jgi:hypothetical protein
VVLDEPHEQEHGAGEQQDDRQDQQHHITFRTRVSIARFL